MILDTIQLELMRLEIHPVNLAVSARDGRSVALRGSLLNYWKAPAIIDGEWFLEILQALPVAAGPERVMRALCSWQDRGGRVVGLLESPNA
jgi:hypothetical protein